MARLTFRQGIVRHQTDALDNPTFLNLLGGTVSLVVSPDPTVITLAHGTQDYLFTEARSVSNAWPGPFIPGTDYWIYWDIDRVTGVRTYGSTTLDPVTSAAAPLGPIVGQHWFNITDTKMYEFNGASWVEKIRVFAAKIDNGTILMSVSVNTPLFTGTQVGINLPISAGAIVFGTGGSPLKDGNGTFFTTEDPFTSGVPTGASNKVNTIIVQAIAQQPLAKFQFVQFVNFNQVIPASPFDQDTVIYGITEEDVATGDVVNVVIDGVMFNDTWDWTSAGVNAPLYINNTGELQTARAIPNQISTATVLDPQCVYIRSPRLISGSGGGGVTVHDQLLGLNADDHTQYYNEVRGDARYSQLAHTHLEADVTDLDKYTTGAVDGLLAGKVSLSGGSMTGILTLTGNPVGVLDASPKQYVDNRDSLLLPLAGGTLTGALVLSGDPTVGAEAATKQYVDSLAAGLDPKESVTAATDGILTGVGLTYSAVGGTGGTGEFTNVDVTSVDGLSLSVGARLLVKDQVDATQNGIYVVVAASALGTIERSADMDGTPASEVTPGDFTFVTEGPTHGSTGWVIQGGTATGPGDTIILNTDAINWTQFSAIAGLQNVVEDLTPQLGGNLDMNTFDINTSEAGGGISVTGGAGVGAMLGGQVTIAGGVSVDQTFVSGGVTLNGAIGPADGTGGGIDIGGGTGTGTYGYGGDIIMSAGIGPYGGNVNITGGETAYAGGGYEGGLVTIQGGGALNNNSGGGVNLKGANGAGTGNGGNILLESGAGTVDGNIVIRAGSGTSGVPELRFEELSAGNEYVALKAPGTIATSRSWVLPQDDPTAAAGDFLTTDASGNLSFAAIPAIPAIPYDILVQGFSAVADATIMLRLMAVRAFTIAASGHDGFAGTSPSGGAATITVAKDPAAVGSPVAFGTIVFNDTSTTVDSETIAQTSFAVGDVLLVTLTTGNNIADFTVTLVGTVD